ncbi:MAG: RdgB/HAM1 family non-canonical purine NTP pyrophosphatase [Candidatus Delongbacteria bacterium]|nr:RdgB/HAM1 family non-canonical purine NTP pyrophosphatase [Candidatus Delongbacteria bacterium]MCG2760960.1 RdgB/HAM1 family non-canonical purine NTP pyrophosphatase [Candidatus Delongbacteria bacterium]
MKILLATHNLNKIKEIVNALKDTGYEILSLNDFPDMPDTIEDGDTLEHNSLKKAKEIYKFSGITTLADDTGLEVEYLNGEPGVFAARWAGEGCTYADNNRKMLRELKGVPYEKRKAVFRCVITLYGKNILKISEGVLKGHITENSTGFEGFGYDPIFIPEGYNITLAEMSLSDKNKISHRGLAVKRMVEIIRQMKKAD